MVCPSELESRQSNRRQFAPSNSDGLPLGIGIKAKRQVVAAEQRRRWSAPRNWNQGKADEASSDRRVVMVCPSELESRQSRATHATTTHGDGLPLGIGIKAKHRCAAPHESSGWSAPRNWNQGKAVPMLRRSRPWMVCPSELESRQSGSSTRPAGRKDGLPLGIGIKAKRVLTPPCGAGGWSA